VLWWEWWVNEKGHKPCEDDGRSNSKKETADPCSAHAPYLNGYEKDNIVRMLTEPNNAAIAVTPIIEADKLE